jgi:hypothetical protein
MEPSDPPLAFAFDAERKGPIFDAYFESRRERRRSAVALAIGLTGPLALFLASYLLSLGSGLLDRWTGTELLFLQGGALLAALAIGTATAIGRDRTMGELDGIDLRMQSLRDALSEPLPTVDWDAASGTGVTVPAAPVADEAARTTLYGGKPQWLAGSQP